MSSSTNIFLKSGEEVLETIIKTRNSQLRSGLLVLNSEQDLRIQESIANIKRTNAIQRARLSGAPRPSMTQQLESAPPRPSMTQQLESARVRSQVSGAIEAQRDARTAGLRDVRPSMTERAFTDLARGTPINREVELQPLRPSMVEELEAPLLQRQPLEIGEGVAPARPGVSGSTLRSVGTGLAAGLGGFAGQQALKELGVPDVVGQPVGAGVGAGAVAGGLELASGATAEAAAASAATTGLAAGAGALGGFVGNVAGQGITRGAEDVIGGTSLGQVEDIKRDVAAKDVGAVAGGFGAAAVAAATTGIGLPLAALLAAIAGGIIVMNHIFDGNKRLEALTALRRGDVANLTRQQKDQAYNYYIRQTTNASSNFDPTKDALFRRGETVHAQRSMEQANLLARNFKKYGMGQDGVYHTTNATRLGKIFVDEDYVDPNTGETKLGWYGFQDPVMRRYAKAATDALLKKKPQDMKDQDFVAQHEKDIISSMWTTMGYYDSILAWDTKKIAIGLEQGLSNEQIQTRLADKLHRESERFHNMMNQTGNKRLIDKIVKQIEHLDRSRVGSHEKFLAEVFHSPLKSLLAEDGQDLSDISDQQVREFDIRSHINSFAFDVDPISDAVPGSGLEILRDSATGISRYELEEAHMDIDGELIRETLALSAAAYETPGMFQIWRDLSKCPGVPRRFYIPGFNYSVVVWINDEGRDMKIMMAFNGANQKEPLGWKDLNLRLHNQSTLLVPSRLTIGYSKDVFVNAQLQSIAESLIEVVMPNFLQDLVVRSHARLVLTGHSLGGALAMLIGTSRRMVCWAKRRGIEKVEIVTYGAPRVGSIGFSRAVENLPNVRITRYSNDMDPAVRLPPSYIGYHHAGLERLIHANGDFTNIFNDGHISHNHTPNPASHDGLHESENGHSLWMYRSYTTNMVRHFDDMGVDLRSLVIPRLLDRSEVFVETMRQGVNNYANKFLHKTVFTRNALDAHTDQLMRFLDVNPDPTSKEYKYVKQQLLHRTYTLNHHRNNVLDTHWI